jgi:hypothetical protein
VNYLQDLKPLVLPLHVLMVVSDIARPDRPQTQAHGLRIGHRVRIPIPTIRAYWAGAVAEPI